MLYFITCIENNKEDSDIRTLGYFVDEKICVQALHENWGDMHEYGYRFAVIESIGEGLYPKVKRRVWFEWNSEKLGFFECDTPDIEMNWCNYAIALG